MTADDETFVRWARKKRRRVLRCLYRAAELKASAIAAKAARRRRRRRRAQPPARLNPVAELRREIMPLIGQMLKLAGGADPASLPMPPAPRRRRRKRA